MRKVLAYLQLMRPANIVTAIADVMAGCTIAFINIELDFAYDHIGLRELMLLSLSTVGLYGGGVVMNDVADRKLDAIERPERPIPSGRATLAGASALGIGLLLMGVISASFVTLLSACIASAIVVLALVYDFFGKHNTFFGPLNMGACRGANLLLGISVSGALLEKYFWLAGIPVVFIAAITMISRGEVLGGNRVAIRYAAGMFLLVIFLIAALPFIYFPLIGHNFQFTILLSQAFLLFVGVPLYRAHSDPSPNKVRRAVKMGVLSLIIMDAALATAFAGWIPGLIILALLPVSLLLARIFAVT